MADECEECGNAYVGIILKKGICRECVAESKLHSNMTEWLNQLAQECPPEDRDALMKALGPYLDY